MGESASSGSERLRRAVDAIFGADLRSLALFRIALASVLLWDLFDRSKSVAAHYGDPGTVPASVLPLITGGAKYSIHVWLADSLAAQWGLLALAFAAALALLVGWQARIAAALSWFLLASLQVRNPLVSWEGADKLLRILLFWSIFAPVAARFSLPSRRAGAPAATSHWLCTPATALFVLQVAAIYWITGMAKTGDRWLDGQALAYTLRNDFFGSPLGAWMRQFDGLLALMTHMSRHMELFGPFLLFVPWRNGLFRLAAMALFYGFHVGILLLMSVGFFSPISMVMWLPLLPGEVWDGLARLRGRAAAAVGPRLATPRIVEAAALGLALFLAASIGFRAFGHLTGRPAPLPGPVVQVAKMLRIRQVWPMFSPNPPPFDAWPVLRGHLADGRVVDPFLGGPVVEEQPESVAAYFPSFKWKIHFWWLGHQSRDDKEPHILWSYLADHLCREWNARHDPHERMLRIDITLLLELIQLEAKPNPIDRWRLGDHPCRSPRG